MSKSDVGEEQAVNEDEETSAEASADEASDTVAADEENEPEVEEEPVEEEPDAEVYKDRWVRLAAEFDNYKKRTLREREALIQSANEGLIRDLLPVVDSVDRANAHSDGDTASEAYQQGVRMIMEELPKILANRGLKEVEASGQTFDPNLHEALMQIHCDHESGAVAEVVERGYRLGEKVLRHAKVVVSQGPAPDGDEKAE